MKKIFAWFLVSSLALAAARAQESATQQQIDKLSGQIQDVLAAQAAQEKRITALEKEINDLRGKLNQSGNGLASRDDLQALAKQVQEIDKKRQEDNERVLKELEHLQKALGASPPAGRLPPSARPTPLKSHSAGGTQNGYDYTIRNGDTISAIARAYRNQGVKVTIDEILKANPGLDPKNMKVGQKVFIPAPAQ